MDSDLQRREEAVARPGRARVRESQLRKHVSDSRPRSQPDRDRPNNDSNADKRVTLTRPGAYKTHDDLEMV